LDESQTRNIGNCISWFALDIGFLYTATKRGLFFTHQKRQEIAFMKTEGSVLPRKMANKVRNPFGENSGKGLTLKKVAKYVKAGAKAIEKDEERSKQITEGMQRIAK